MTLEQPDELLLIILPNIKIDILVSGAYEKLKITRIKIYKLYLLILTYTYLLYYLYFKLYLLF